MTNIAPVFEVFWEYVFNVREKSLYLGSGFAGRGCAALNHAGITILRDEPDFRAFALWLRSRIPNEAIAKRRERALQDERELSYVLSLNDTLDEHTRIEVLKFALSAVVLQSVLPYFRVAPRVGSIGVMLNVTKPELGQVGSKAWHRDGAQYKALNIFMCLSEVDDDSGAYYAIGKNHIPLHAFVPDEPRDRASLSAWTKWRHTDDHMRKFVAESAATKLAGPSGTTALVDPGALYHKGGYCKTRDRIMLQIGYVTDVPTPIPNIVTQLGLTDRAELGAVLNTRIRRYMASGNEDVWYRRLGLKNPIYFLGRRILSYPLQTIDRRQLR